MWKKFRAYGGYYVAWEKPDGFHRYPGYEVDIMTAAEADAEIASRSQRDLQLIDRVLEQIAESGPKD